MNSAGKCVGRADGAVSAVFSPCLISWAAGDETIAIFIFYTYLFIWLCRVLDSALRLNCPDSCGNLVLDPVLCVGRQTLNHWTAREILAISFL